MTNYKQFFLSILTAIVALFGGSMAVAAQDNVWSEDFSGNALPEGWSVVGGGWTFENGEAKGSYVNGRGGYLVTPKLVAEAGQSLTFQARSYQWGTDLIVQYQKDGGDWTQAIKKALDSSTAPYETYSIDNLEAGTYSFRIATENLYLDNFEGLKLATSTATKETWHIKYTFHYMGDNNEEVADTDTEDMEVEFDGDDLAFNFPNPINGNAWMRGTKYDGEGPEMYIFPNGQLFGQYGGENVYYCGSNGNSLTDMTFFYDADQQAFFNFEHILLNSSTTIADYWGYFSDVVIYKDQEPTLTGIGHVANTHHPSPTTQVYDLQGRRVAAPTKGLYIINGRKVVMK